MITLNCEHHQIRVDYVEVEEKKNVLVFSKREKTGGETRCNRNVRKKEVKKEDTLTSCMDTKAENVVQMYRICREGKHIIIERK